jgi:hypothetical protein
MNKTKWYEESPGVNSSKRIFGGLCLALGLIGKVVLFVSALFFAIADAATASGQADALLLAGTTLLGIGALDVFKRAA